MCLTTCTWGSVGCGRAHWSVGPAGQPEPVRQNPAEREIQAYLPVSSDEGMAAGSGTSLRAQKSVPDSAIEWPTFLPPPLESCSGTANVDGPNYCTCSIDVEMGWVGLWGFLWWATSADRKDHHGVSSEWSSVGHCSNTGLSSTQYEQIPIIFKLTRGLAILADSHLFLVSNILAGLWLNCISSVEITLFLLADMLLQHRSLFQC